MSVDETIRELSGTIAQLGLLVGKINEQMGGISSRINITLQTFDDSVSGIAKDANKMTEQVDSTIAQIPGSWAFYLLFFTLLAVLVLLSVLIVINLVLKVQDICRLMRGDSSRASTPLQPLVQAESKQQPFHPSMVASYSYPARHPAPESTRQRPHIAVEMEAEPRRYGIGGPSPFSGRTTASTAGAASVFHQPPQRNIPPAGGEFFAANGNGPSAGSPSGSELRGRFGQTSVGGSPRSQQGSDANLLPEMPKQQKPMKHTLMRQWMPFLLFTVTVSLVTSNTVCSFFVPENATSSKYY